MAICGVGVTALVWHLIMYTWRRFQTRFVKMFPLSSIKTRFFLVSTASRMSPMSNFVLVL